MMINKDKFCMREIPREMQGDVLSKQLNKAIPRGKSIMTRKNNKPAHNITQNPSTYNINDTFIKHFESSVSVTKVQTL